DTAAIVPVSISGRVLADTCRGLRGIRVRLSDSGGNSTSVTTSSFGYYRFDGVNSPGSYTLNVVTKGYTFLSRTLDLTTDVTNIDLVAGTASSLCVNAGPDRPVVLPGGAQLNGVAVAAANVSTTWSKVSGPGNVAFDNPANATASATFSAQGLYILRLSATDGTVSASDDVSVTVNPVNVPPPPDPATVAPPLSKTIATNISNATKFLYTGPNAIQTVGLLRGKVTNKAGTPLSNVVISILDHPEFGQTRSRADGMFDMVVNAGGELTIKYEKTNYITAQREEKIDWQTYRSSDDVVMMPYDPNVTEIDLTSATPIQVASGSPSNDASGQRRSRLFFKQGTTATVTLPNNMTQTLPRLNVRATEFTVGDSGRSAMPGDLPPTSEYTYATEYSVDEAVALNAVKTEFSQPVIQYLENFIGFPTGVVVPTGSYNKQTGDWEPEENGKVVKVLSTSGGIANLDLTGSGSPATDQEYADLGINVAERQKLTEFYQTNQSLWRVPLRHFSSWDCNYPSSFKPPPDAPPPFFPKPKKDCEEEDGCTENIQPQTVVETVEIHQTGYQIILNREPLPLGALIPLVGPTPQKDVVAVAAIVNIAGRTIKSDIMPVTPGLTFDFQWDGLDEYARRTQGKQRATVSVVNFYPLAYAIPGQPGSPQFGQPGNGSGQIVTGTGRSIALRNYEFELGGSDRSVTDLGGWAFGIHHIYNPVTRTLIEGNGNQRTASAIVQSIVTTAGSTDEGFA
ncbi:MAG: carboxypeptidase-like regulatory domain-containing protein, partial [Pyrinomonadaceae bacterium]